MGQKIHPNGFRVGVTEGWNSRWFAPKKLFGELLIEDQAIRSYVDKKLNRQAPYAAIAKVEIERTREELRPLVEGDAEQIHHDALGRRLQHVEHLGDRRRPLRVPQHHRAGKRHVVALGVHQTILVAALGQSLE